MFFDNSKYFDFVERCRKAGITVPIIPGIKPISTPKHLEILPRTFSVSLPEELVKAVRACGEDTQAAREVGIEWAIHQPRSSRRPKCRSSISTRWDARTTSARSPATYSNSE